MLKLRHAIGIIMVFTPHVLSLLLTPKQPCCTCGEDINITLIAENILKPPFFNISVAISSPQRELIYLLQKAVDIDERFRFTASYWGGELGHYITSINKVDEDIPRKRFWSISDQNGNTTGTTNHIPKHGDVILLNYTTFTSELTRR